MYPIRLTHRTILQRWNEETLGEVEVITDEVIYVNPELIEWFGPANDAPNKYRSHVRMHGGWDLFVVEPPGLVDSLIKRARYNVLFERAIEKP